MKLETNMDVIKNFDLTNYNSYRIKATCRLAYFPTCETDFIEIFEKHAEQEIIIIGGGV